MEVILQDAYKKKNINSANRTHLKGLIARELLSEDLSLTKEGRLHVLSRLSLTSQCEDLDIPLQTIEWDSSTKPEIWTSNYYSDQGFANAYCEGGAIGLVLKGLCLDALTRTSYFHGTSVSSREDACLKGIVTLSSKSEDELDEIIEEIHATDHTKYLKNCEEILSYPAISEWYPGLSIAFINQMYEALSKDEYERIARWISTNPEHRNGWPDITLVRNAQVYFVEVKTNDKLHRSQLITFPSLRNLIDSSIHILKLKKLKANKGLHRTSLRVAGEASNKMDKEQEWTFYWRAAWNLDQATHVARLLMDSNRNDFSDDERRIRSAALDFCVVSYCSPFLKFNIEENKRISGLSREEIVPQELLNVHNQVFTYRDKEISHTDISHLSVAEFERGGRVISSRTYTSLPSIADCFRLFDLIRAKIAKKLEVLTQDAQCQQDAAPNADKPH